jgi:hypothetical protein
MSEYLMVELPQLITSTFMLNILLRWVHHPSERCQRGWKSFGA